MSPAGLITDAVFHLYDSYMWAYHMATLKASLFLTCI